MSQRLGRSCAANSRFFLCSRLALTAGGHMPRPAASSHGLAPRPPLLSLLPPVAASQGTLLLPPPFAAGLHEECAPVRQFRVGRSRVLGDVEDHDLLLPQSRVLLHAVERRPCSPDARGPPAKEPSSVSVQTPSTPPPSQWRPAPSLIQRPCHPSAPAPQLYSPSVSAASRPKQRRGAPCHEPRQRRQTSRPDRPPSRFHTNARLPRWLAPFMCSVCEDARREASPLPLLRRGRRRQAAARAWRWRTQMDKRRVCPVVKQFY